MKRANIYLLLAGFLLNGTIAMAQIDPEPDGIGIYLDRGAMVPGITHEPFEPFQVYLLITHPSCSEGVIGWSATIEYPDNAVVWGWNVAGRNWLNFGAPPYFVVGYADPLPLGPIVQLLSFIIQVTDSNPASFYLSAGEGEPAGDNQPCYLDADDIGDYIPLYPWPRQEGAACFAVNAGTTTDTHSATWGGVKQLYR